MRFRPIVSTVRRSVIESLRFMIRKKLPKLIMLRCLSDVQRPPLPEEISRTIFSKARDVQSTLALAIAILNGMEIDAEYDGSFDVQ